MPNPMQSGFKGSTALTPPPMAAAGAAMPSAPGDLGPQSAPAPEEQPNVTPQEQEEYDKVVNNAYKMLYTDMDTTLQGISGGGDPVVGLANTVATTMSMITDSALKAGQTFADGVILNAGAEVLGDMADLAKDSGLHDFTPVELENATYLAAEQYRTLQQDNIDPNVQANDMNQMIEADQAGTLDQLLPGLQMPTNAPEGQAGAPAPAPAPAPGAAPAPRKGLAV